MLQQLVSKSRSEERSLSFKCLTRMTSKPPKLAGASREAGWAAACPHWLWRSLLLWLPQPRLLEAISSKNCCTQHIRSPSSLCKCDRWPASCTEQGRAGPRHRKLVITEEGVDAVGVVHYALPGLFPEDIHPSSTIQRRMEDQVAPNRVALPELSNPNSSPRSRGSSPPRFMQPVRQMSPSSHPRLFTASIGNKVMEEPLSALKHRHRRAKRMPSRDREDTVMEAADNSKHSGPNLNIVPLFRSSDTTTEPVPRNISSAGAVASQVRRRYQTHYESN